MPQGDADHYQALFAVARAINSTLDEDEVLHLVARHMTDALAVRGCALRLLSDHDTLDLVASHGLSDQFLGKGEVRPEAASATKSALQGSAIVAHIDDTAAWQYPEEARREGIATSLTIPLRVEDDPIGIVRMYSATRRDFSEDEIEFAMALADLAALSIHNARLHHALEREKEILTEYTFGPSTALR